MARPTWSGAVEFGGFLIHVSAYPLTKTTRGESFKTLCPCHGQPIQQARMCPVDWREVEYDDCVKGYEVAKGDVRPVPAEAIEAIKSMDKSESLAIEQLPLAANVPFHLALARYRIVPNEKVPGAEQPVQILWNGLYASGRTVVTEWVPRAGSADSILAVFADRHGLTGVALPYEAELRVDVPEFLPVENEQAAQMFEQFAAMQGIDMDDAFAHSRFESQYRARREKALEDVLAGKPVEVPQAKSTKPAAPDLLAAMSAALDAAPAAKKKPKKAAPKAKAKAGAR